MESGIPPGGGIASVGEEGSGVARAREKKATAAYTKRAPGPERRKFLLIVVDGLGLALAFLISLSIWTAIAGLGFWEQLRGKGWLTGTIPIWIGLGHILGIYNGLTTRPTWRLFGLLLGTASVFLVGYQAAYFFAPREFLLRLAVLMYALTAIPVLLFGRILFAAVLRDPKFYRRVLVLGGLRRGRLVRRLVSRYGKDVYLLAGWLPEERGPTLAYTVHTEEGERDFPTLRKAVTHLGVTDVVLVEREVADLGLLQDLSSCAVAGAQVSTLPDFMADLTGQVPVYQLNPQSYMRLFLDWGRERPLYESLKRILDVVGAIVGLVFLGLLLIPLAPLILLTSRGPLFYRQERLGRHGRRFRIAKLRTMVAGAEEGVGPVWASRSDKRVTAVGRVLRATGLDEFPQFWNVLKGEMSLVGPRPERPELVEEIVRTEPLFGLRTIVRPGLTGWALVQSGYARNVNASRVKLRYDLYYIKRRSLALDLAIIVSTVGLILAARGGRG